MSLKLSKAEKLGLFFNEFLPRKNVHFRGEKRVFFASPYSVADMV